MQRLIWTCAVIGIVILPVDARCQDSQQRAEPKKLSVEVPETINAQEATKRQTPKTDFGSIAGRGASKASVEIESLLSQTQSLRSRTERQAVDNATTVQALRNQVRIAESRSREYQQLIDELEASERELQRILTSGNAESDMANIDLQDGLQRQQQTYEALSQMSKTQHDTAKTIIQNSK